MAHLTCVGAGRRRSPGCSTGSFEGGIENVMALRGDPPAGRHVPAAPGGFAYAADLVASSASATATSCAWAAPAIPKATWSAATSRDIDHLKAKVDAGVDFVITQLFFDNRGYFDFVERARAAGIRVPIVPG